MLISQDAQFEEQLMINLKDIFISDIVVLYKQRLQLNEDGGAHRGFLTSLYECGTYSFMEKLQQGVLIYKVNLL
jgi:hypothetical protein